MNLDGELRSFRMKADPGDDIKVTFANEYDESHGGPFHFLDQGHEKTLDSGFAECSAKKLPENRYQQIGQAYQFTTSWIGISIEGNQLSYYAISLPEFSVPKEVKV